MFCGRATNCMDGSSAHFADAAVSWPRFVASMPAFEQRNTRLFRSFCNYFVGGRCYHWLAAAAVVLRLILWTSAKSQQSQAMKFALNRSPDASWTLLKLVWIVVSYIGNCLKLWMVNTGHKLPRRIKCLRASSLLNYGVGSLESNKNLKRFAH